MIATIANYFLNVQRSTRLFLLFFADFLTIFGATLLIVYIETEIVNFLEILTLVTIAFLIFAGIGLTSGLYSASIRHAGVYIGKRIILATSGLIVLGNLFCLTLNHSYNLNFWLLAFLLVGSATITSRIFVREVLFSSRQVGAPRTLIYGAGLTGIQFLTSTMQGDTYNVLGLVERDQKFVGKTINGRKVYPASEIEVLIEELGIELVVLALPSVKKEIKSNIINQLINHLLF